MEELRYFVVLLGVFIILIFAVSSSWGSAMDEYIEPEQDKDESKTNKVRKPPQ